jgi:hypothetical protein
MRMLLPEYFDILRRQRAKSSRPPVSTIGNANISFSYSLSAVVQPTACRSEAEASGSAGTNGWTSLGGALNHCLDVGLGPLYEPVLPARERQKEQREPTLHASHCVRARHLLTVLGLRGSAARINAMDGNDADGQDKQHGFEALEAAGEFALLYDLDLGGR